MKRSRLPRERPLTTDSFRELELSRAFTIAEKRAEYSSEACEPRFRVPLPIDTYVALWLGGQQLASLYLVWYTSDNAAKHWENRATLSKQRGKLRNGNNRLLSKSFEYETKAKLYRQQAYEANIRYWQQFDAVCELTCRSFGYENRELLAFFCQVGDYFRDGLIRKYKGTEVFYYMMAITTRFRSIEAKPPMHGGTHGKEKRR